VRPLDFPLLTDENIAPDVVAGLRARGCDVRSAAEERLIGRADGEVLKRATALHRVTLTHDLAFGKVDIRGGASFVGIVTFGQDTSPRRSSSPPSTLYAKPRLTFNRRSWASPNGVRPPFEYAFALRRHGKSEEVGISECGNCVRWLENRPLILRNTQPRQVIAFES
jgi:hypothetical protein